MPPRPPRHDLLLISITSLFSTANSLPLQPRTDGAHLHQLRRRYYNIDQSTVIPVATIVGVIFLAIFFCSFAGCFKAKNRGPALTSAQNAEFAFEIHSVGCPKNPNTIGKSRNGGRCTCNANRLSQTQPSIIHAFGCPKRPGLGQLGHRPDAQCTCSALGEVYGSSAATPPPVLLNGVTMGSYSHDGQIIHADVDAPPAYSPPMNTPLTGLQPVYSPQREERANATVWTEQDIARQAPEVQTGRRWSRWAA